MDPRAYLVCTENIGLFKHGIDHGRLAVINMRNDGNISDAFSQHIWHIVAGSSTSGRCVRGGCMRHAEFINESEVQ